jgi:DNA-binding transcriptional MerR regulator
MSGDKRYYKIGEVCKLAGIKPHVLRYWEKEIKNIRPDRSLKNHRLYSSETMEKILKIKKMVDEGYKLDSARKKLYGYIPPDIDGILNDLKNDLQKVKTLLEY